MLSYGSASTWHLATTPPPSQASHCWLGAHRQVQCWNKPGAVQHGPAACLASAGPSTLHHRCPACPAACPPASPLTHHTHSCMQVIAGFNFELSYTIACPSGVLTVDASVWQPAPIFGEVQPFQVRGLHLQCAAVAPVLHLPVPCRRRAGQSWWGRLGLQRVAGVFVGASV